MLMEALKFVYQWFLLGIYLGMKYSVLMNIKRNDGLLEMCKRSMLSLWLGCPDETKRSKQLLQNALKQVLPHSHLILIPGGFRCFMV